ncbi:Uncharacterised protein [Escherichia coli]|nr:Uncharacterised protein [Escherichia coli]
MNKNNNGAYYHNGFICRKRVCITGNSCAI